MRDEAFQCFIDEFGEATRHIPVPEEAIKKWQGRLPDSLLYYWKTEGWNSYQNGLLSLVNPDDYEDILDLWLEDTGIEEKDSFQVFAMTAFGVLFARGETTNHTLTLSCPTNEIFYNEKRAIHIETFFAATSLEYADMIDDANQSLFQRAIKKYGPLTENEIFGFEPALFLGGRCLISNLKKLDAQIHLDILGQFAGPVIFNV